MHLPQPPRRRGAVWAAAAFTATALLTASTPALATGAGPADPAHRCRLRTAVIGARLPDRPAQDP
ncbi:hypothetical protein ACFYW9_12920 [Streptomyces sp. NPDC002698]|uniref:hypothetical protein n=1 Tax=Streptomyces sp. NPDC002698 TaxID=3364660 RepID=UPI0036AAAEF7